jgi:hypothetical protein
MDVFNRKPKTENGTFREANSMAQRQPPTTLTPRDELLMKAAKEIVVKFIEVGRVSPSGFADTFKMVIDTLRQSLKD